MICFKRIIPLFFLFLSIFQPVLQASVRGALIPFSIYPTNEAIQPLLDAKSLHPNVPMRVILDPASGPGTSQDLTYVAAIETLQNAGIETVGYVYTNYNARPIQEVMDEIALWKDFYNPDGIFLDAMGTQTSYYQSLTNYIKSLGMQFSIGNAGMNVDPSTANYVDTVVIANGDYLPPLSDYANWQTVNTPDHAAFLLYHIDTFPTGFIYEVKKFAGWIYITDGGGLNPWNTLPSYFNLLISALDKVKTGTIFPFYIYPTQAAIQPLIDCANQYPNVPIWAILDPANGPGSTIDPVYVNAVTQLRSAGINLLGYVNTNYGQRSKNLVQGDMRKWMNWYQPDGIFLDLMSVKHPYYSSLTSYAKSLGFMMVNGNPGTNIDPSARNDVDIVTIFENNYLPTPLTQFSNWYNITPSANLSLISYNIPFLPVSFIQQAIPHFDWLYFTDSNASDPYETYPTYFNDFIQLLSTQ